MKNKMFSKELGKKFWMFDILISPLFFFIIEEGNFSDRFSQFRLKLMSKTNWFMLTLRQERGRRGCPRGGERLHFCVVESQSSANL